MLFFIIILLSLWLYEQGFALEQGELVSFRLARPVCPGRHVDKDLFGHVRLWQYGEARCTAVVASVQDTANCWSITD